MNSPRYMTAVARPRRFAARCGPRPAFLRSVPAAVLGLVLLVFCRLPAAAATAEALGDAPDSVVADAVPQVPDAPPAHSGVDKQGRAAWRELEPGLLFGEFQLNDGDARLTAVRIDPTVFEFVLCARSREGGPPRTLRQWGEQQNLTAAINASMYLPDGSTSTGYMRQGGHVNNSRVVQRFGAFFVAGPTDPSLPPAHILDRDEPQWRQQLDSYDMVIQNYRMISAGRRILWSPGGPLYSISAVAEDGEGQRLFLHCSRPVEAYSFAQQVLHLPLDVRTVMYVEGGGQAGLLVRSAALTRELGGVNPGGLLVTGNLRATLPNVLGARRKAAPASSLIQK
ncbi:MAG: phosphodiester glycosidase family protein [Desulfovibrio sp.]|nr:phosphodiester glycosidase family protein [Desulfovibrio sp.]